MLGHYWRLSVNNQAGVDVDVTVNARLWKIDSSGALVYSAETSVFSVTGIASSTSAWSAGANQNNSSTLYMGAELEVTIAPVSSATGPVTVQVQRSTDAGTDWPSDGLGEFVTRHTFSASATAVKKLASID